MRKFLVVMLATMTMLSLASVASAAPNKLRTFGTGEVTVTSASSAVIDNDAGEYGGVYVQGYKAQTGKLLSQVDYSFTSRADVAGGAPRFSIPIDENRDGGTEAYAFIDAFGCGATGSGGFVFVSTTNSNCQVFYQDVTYQNWDAFAAANPTYRISDDVPFIISDQPGHYELTGILLK